MTSLRSSTLLFAAFAPAPVSCEAVSRLVAAGPILKVEKVAEELEDFVFSKKPQPKRTAEVSLQQGCRLLKVRQHPRCFDDIIIWLACEA